MTGFPLIPRKQPAGPSNLEADQRDPSTCELPENLDGHANGYKRIRLRVGWGPTDDDRLALASSHGITAHR